MEDNNGEVEAIILQNVMLKQEEQHTRNLGEVKWQLELAELRRKFYKAKYKAMLKKPSFQCQGWQVNEARQLRHDGCEYSTWHKPRGWRTL